MSKKSDMHLDELIDRYEAANFTVTRNMEFMVKELIHDELTPDQYSTLRYIHRHGSCTSSEISGVFCVGKSSITAIINRLFEKNLISRESDPLDRRIIHLSLTDEGRKVYEISNEKIHKLTSDLLVYFDEKEIRTFIETYEKLAALVHIDERKNNV